MKRSILNLASIAFIGGVIGGATKYLSSIIISRGFGPEFLGYFSFGLTVVTALGILSTLGLDTGAQNLIPNNSEYDGSISDYIGLSVITTFSISVCISGISLLALYSGYIPSTIPIHYLSIFFVLIPFYAVFNLSLGLLKGHKYTTRFTVSKYGVQSGILLAGAIVGAYLLQNFFVILAGYTLSLIVGISVSFWFLRDETEYTVPSLSISPVFRKSIPMMTADLFQFLLTWSDIVLLGILVSPSFVGWYQASYLSASILLIFLQSINAIFPSAISSVDTKKATRSIYQSITKWILYLTTLAGIGLITHKEWVLDLFGNTPSWVGSSVLVPLTLAMIISAGAGPAGYLLMMTGYERLESINILLFAIFNIIANYILIVVYGPPGAAVATGVAFIGLNLTRLCEIRYLHGYYPVSKNVFKIFPSLVLGSIIIIFGKQYYNSILLQIGIGFLSPSSLLLYYFWGLDQEDMTLIEAI